MAPLPVNLPPPWLAATGIGEESSKYTTEKAHYICRQLALGRSLHEICKEPDMPNMAVVHWWVKVDYDNFKAKYNEARKFALLAWADQVTGIADDGTNDFYKDAGGVTRFNREHVLRSTLRMKARQWMLSKHMRDVYGDQPADVSVDDNKVVRDEPQKQLDTDKQRWMERFSKDAKPTNGKSH